MYNEDNGLYEDDTKDDFHRGYDEGYYCGQEARREVEKGKSVKHYTPSQKNIEFQVGFYEGFANGFQTFVK